MVFNGRSVLFCQPHRVGVYFQALPVGHMGVLSDHHRLQCVSYFLLLFIHFLGKDLVWKFQGALCIYRRSVLIQSVPLKPPLSKIIKQ